MQQESLAIILYPFIPTSAKKIWHQLGYYTDLEGQDWYAASEIFVENGHVLSKEIEPIFKKIEKEDIERQKASIVEQ